MLDEHLIAERVRLWNLLNLDKDKLSLVEVQVVRGVICCLYEDTYDLQWKSHVFDATLCAMDFCNAVENHEEEQYKLLNEIFESYLVNG